MTPTPHDITSAEKVVAELLSGADGWEIAVDHEIRLYGEGTEDAIGMQARADMYRRAATLIESQRATIERDRAAVFDAMGDAVRFMDPPDGGDPTQAEMVANMRRQLEAAEARVTALVRDLTSVKQQCETAVYNISQREHDAAVVRSFQNIADFSAQALSRSSTEVKNDE